MKDNNLDTIRREIDTIDEEIAKLLNRRFNLVEDVAALKNEGGIPVEDKARESEIVQRLKKTVSNPYLADMIESFYSKVLEASRTIQELEKNKDIVPYAKIGIIGLGTIGGSIIKTLKKQQPTIHIATIKRESRDEQLAIAAGDIDEVHDRLEDLCSTCDLIIIATPITNIVEYAKKIKAAAGDRVLTVIDVGSVKASIAREFESLSTDTVQFIPTHPMAGSHLPGFDHSSTLFFIHRPWVITPHSKNTVTEIEKVKKLISILGSKPVVMDPDQHDTDVAQISHLAIVLAALLFAYVHDEHKDALAIATSGFERITEKVSGNTKMHAQIVEENEANIKSAIDEFVAFIQKKQVSKSTAQSFFEHYKSLRDQVFTN